MKTAAGYMARAFEFERIANTTADPAFKQRYADLADCFPLLAKERDRFAGQQPEQPTQSPKH
jgi:hypothetical protein